MSARMSHTEYIYDIEVSYVSDVSYGEVLGDKSTMHIRVTLYWGYLIVLWLFHLVCILYSGCFNLFCNMWVCVTVGFVMRGFVHVYVGFVIYWSVYVWVFRIFYGSFGNICTCIDCVFVLFLLCIFTLIC